MSTPSVDSKTALASSERIWDGEILPALERYIRIPNKSPAFDPDWVKKGHMEEATRLIADWCQAQAQHIPGLKVVDPTQVNVYDVLDCKNLLVTQEALTKLEERLTP